MIILAERCKILNNISSRSNLQLIITQARYACVITICKFDFRTELPVFRANICLAIITTYEIVFV